MSDAAEVVKALAWPVDSLIFLLVLRGEFTRLITALTSKVETAAKLKITKNGIELAEAISRGSVSLGGKIDSRTKEELMAELEGLEKQYKELSIADESERIVARRRLADRMGQVATQLGISNADLVKRQNEGAYVTAATVVLAQPKQTDLAVLEDIARSAKFNFTRYRTTLALIPLLNKRRIGKPFLRRVDQILDDIEDGGGFSATPSLKKLIETTRNTVADLAGET